MSEINELTGTSSMLATGWTMGLLIHLDVNYLGESAFGRLVNDYQGPFPRIPRVQR